MQSYRSAVDGKTLIRVGGVHNSQSLSRPSSSTVKSEPRISSAASSSRASVTSTTKSAMSMPSHVTIKSQGMPSGVSTLDGRHSNASVTVKSIAPGKKMASIIDTKTGHVTSSIVSQETGRKSSSSSVLTSSPTNNISPLSIASPSLVTYGPESPSNDSNLNWMTSSSPRATSVLMTSTGMQVNSTNSETTKMADGRAKSLSRSSSSNDTNPVTTIQSSSSVILKSIPVTSPAEITSSGSATVTAAAAEVHPEPKTLDIERPQTDPAGSSTVMLEMDNSAKIIRESSSCIQDDTGSLVFADDLDIRSSVIGENKDTVVDDSAEVIFSGANSRERKTSDLTSTPPSSLPSTSSTSELTATTSSGISNVMQNSMPEVVGSQNGSDRGLDLEPETRQTTTFHFIGWDEAESTNMKNEAKFQRVLIYKDGEIVLMFKAICESEKVSCNPRLHELMTDIAINCAERLKKMKDITQAEHMDTLPLSDSRSTKEHLEEISRQLNETIYINDVAYRFQSEDGVFVGTHVTGTVVTAKKRNCEIGVSGVVVVLLKRNRFATVEAFSDQLCRHIVTNTPTSLGRVSENDLRELSLRRETAKSKTTARTDQLLLQDFQSDPSILVAEAARRSFLRIEDFLLF